MRGSMFGGPYNKDHLILASVLGFPYSGKLSFRTLTVLYTPASHIKPYRAAGSPLSKLFLLNWSILSGSPESSRAFSE